MTNLFILTPEIPKLCKTITAAHLSGSQQSDTFTNQRKENCRFGLRHYFTKLTGYNYPLVQFDLGNAPLTANYLAIARADLLPRTALSTLELRASNTNNVATATVIFTRAVNTTTLLGTKSNDYIETFTTTASYRYWWVIFGDNVTSTVITFSKIFLGNMFDIGIDPDDIQTSEKNNYADESYSSGARITGLTCESEIIHEIKWKLVSDAKVVEFCQKVLDNRHRNEGVFLYTSTNNAILQNKKLIHCLTLNDFAIESSGFNKNTISASFKEIY